GEREREGESEMYGSEHQSRHTLRYPALPISFFVTLSLSHHFLISFYHSFLLLHLQTVGKDVFTLSFFSSFLWLPLSLLLSLSLVVLVEGNFSPSRKQASVSFLSLPPSLS